MKSTGIGKLTRISSFLENLKHWPHKQQVFQNFGFLEEEYDFVIERDDTKNFSVFIATSKRCVIKIFIDTKETAVTIEPVGEAKQELIDKGHTPKAIEIGLIVEYCEPELVRPRRWEMSYSVALQWLSFYTKKHCKNMLAGDFSQLSELEKFSEERKNKI